MEPKRIGGVTRLKPGPEILEKYKEAMKSHLWQEVLEDAKIKNHIVYYLPQEHILFSHAEYIGNNYIDDIKMFSSESSKYSKWFHETHELRNPLPSQIECIRWFEPCEELFFSGSYPTQLSETCPEVVPKYVGGVIKLRPEKYDEYKKLHAAVWPEVLDRIKQSNIRNYVIYYSRDLGLMLSSFDYVGSDFSADMAAIGEDPVTRRWWAECEPCQEPLQWEGPPPSQGGRGEGGEWWATAECLYHSPHHPLKYRDV